MIFPSDISIFLNYPIGINKSVINIGLCWVRRLS